MPAFSARSARFSIFTVVAALLLFPAPSVKADSDANIHPGYYRDPAIHGDT